MSLPRQSGTPNSLLRFGRTWRRLATPSIASEMYWGRWPVAHSALGSAIRLTSPPAPALIRCRSCFGSSCSVCRSLMLRSSVLCHAPEWPERPPSTTLASWTPRPWAARALDMGTGSGVQALHLCGHSAYRAVSDLSPRALAFAAFACALNGVEVDARGGSLFEPVAGATFDLIVCNPPFVITARDAGLDTLHHRDGGAVGDGLVAEVVSRIGDHLNPGGIGQLLGNWELAAGQDWSERVSSGSQGGWTRG